MVKCILNTGISSTGFVSNTLYKDYSSNMRMDIEIYNHPHLEVWAVLSTGGKK